MRKRPPKRRSANAKALQSPALRARVVPDKRKQETRKEVLRIMTEAWKQ